jgi:hypothetical protein
VLFLVHIPSWQPGFEGDAQDVFVRGMAFDGDGRLNVVDELGRRPVVDVKTRISTPVPGRWRARRATTGARFAAEAAWPSRRSDFH